MWRVLRATGLVSVSLGLALLGLEGAYRYQLVDMYRPELVSFNAAAALAQDTAPTLLVMGDSFTAGRTSYAGLLQERLPTWRVVNAGVSGTGALQALYMAPRRFAHFRPRLFLYQVYVGNDLFDLRYPLNWRTLSPGRNLYWFLANHLRVFGYVNYRLRQLTTTSQAWATDAPPAFEAERYDARVRIYLRAEPTLLQESVHVQGPRQHEYARFLTAMTQLLAYCQPAACRALVLVIPHVGQVDATALDTLRQLGAQVDAPAWQVTDYPFVARLREHLAAWPHVQVLNPLSMLRQQQRHQAVYYTYDEHLNAAGQQALTAWLLPHLALP